MNYKETVKEVNTKIKSCKLSDERDFEALNAYVWDMKQPYVLSAEGTIEYYAYFAMQNFCLFMDKCREKHLKGLSLSKIEIELKRYWTKTYNKFV